MSDVVGRSMKFTRLQTLDAWTNDDTDLNYRINLADVDVRTLLEASQHQGPQTLLKYDQLALAMRTKKAFTNFVEAPIHHLPYVLFVFLVHMMLRQDRSRWLNCLLRSYRFASGLLTDSLGYDTKSVTVPFFVSTAKLIDAPFYRDSSTDASRHGRIVCYTCLRQPCKSRTWLILATQS